MNQAPKSIFLALMLLGFGFAVKANAATYYVSNAGSDSANGTSVSAPWKTIAKVNASTFQPGDFVLFEHGGLWRETLVIDNSGTAGNPITFGAYGSGNAPEIRESNVVTSSWTGESGLYYASGFSADPKKMVFDGVTYPWVVTKAELVPGRYWYDSVNGRVYVSVNPAGRVVESGKGIWTRCVEINADYTVLQNLKLTRTHEQAVRIGSGADYNIVEGCEMTQTGFGVSVYGQYNQVRRNNIHNLDIIVNTPGGNGEDYGAVGVLVSSSNNDVYENTLAFCRAPSYDFVYDGGTFEINGTSVNNNRFYRNRAENNDAVVEISQSTASNNQFYYNVFKNLGFVGGISGGQDGVTGLIFWNNTFIELVKPEGGQDWEMIYFEKTPNASTATFRNNIFYLGRYFNAVSHQSAYTHSNNLYYLGAGSGLGFTDEAGKILADPKFVSATDPHLQAISPAINAGMNLNLASDNDGKPIVGLPDIGAFEYQPAAIDTPPAAPTGLAVY